LISIFLFFFFPSGWLKVKKSNPGEERKKERRKRKEEKGKKISSGVVIIGIKKLSHEWVKSRNNQIYMLEKSLSIKPLFFASLMILFLTILYPLRILDLICFD